MDSSKNLKEKLVYRSHFQPAPHKRLAEEDDTRGFRLPTLPRFPAARRGSPYRSSRTSRQFWRNVLRIGLFVVLLVLFDSITGWRKTYARWFRGQGIVKSMQEWREAYDSLDLGLKGLPISYKLPSGDDIPSVALGTWRSPEEHVGAAVKAALEAGYRHIDGAWTYGNEVEVGEALKSMSHQVPRESIFITSKLWNTFHSPEAIEPSLDETLSRLQTNYLDLYLIHWPVAWDEERHVDIDLTENPIRTWKKLEELVQKGKIRNIGLSNFNIRRIQNLTSSDITILPAVNQVELNYWNPQPELLEWSKQHGILLEAYSPLGSTDMVSRTLKLPVVKKIAKKLNITPAQVIISWHVQRGTVVLPKSLDAGRISENYQIFTLPSALFTELETAATSHRPYRLSDPSDSWGIDIFEDGKDDDHDP